MNTVNQLTKELNEMNAKRNEIKETNTVETGGPQIKRTFTYRKSPAIKACDVRSI